MGVALTATIAQSEIEKSVRTEGELARFVVGERLVLRQKDAFARRVRLVRIGRHFVFGDYRLQLAVEGSRVVDVKTSIAGKVRMKSDSQQAQLITAALAHSSADVEECSRQHSTLEDA